MTAPYEGNREYIFVNYTHADRDVVLPIIDALDREGYRVWYDDGIQVGAQFPDYIADHVRRCACFLMFISRSSLKSPWCEREAYFAVQLRKSIFPVYLEDVELTFGLQMSVGTLHALLWYKFGSEDEFCSKLFATEILDSCLTEAGRRRRGVKPRDFSNPSVIVGNELCSGGMSIDSFPDRITRPIDIVGIKPRSSFAEYSWAELKQLSRFIAAARTEAEGLRFALEYHLIERDGNLWGNEKPLKLKDGTKTSIRILGFRHDELVGGGKSGISFEFADVPKTHRVRSNRTNTDGWRASEIRLWLNEDFFALLPDELLINIVEVKKWTKDLGEFSTLNNASVVTSTSDRLWLLSPSEVYGVIGDVCQEEGVQYWLYADHDVSTKNYAYCRKVGASFRWWLRSPRSKDHSSFYEVLDDGRWGSCRADGIRGVSPGFCF